MAIRADDGTILRPKEAIVLDRNGDPIEQPSSETKGNPFSHSSKTRVFQLGGLSSILMLAAGAVAVTLGSIFVIAFLMLLFTFHLFRKVLKAL